MNVRQVVPRDAIPSVDDPEFVAEYFGEDDEEVIVVDGDPSRAYPVRILHYHEIVNDVVDGRPVAVTWCPLCGSAVVYDRRVDTDAAEGGDADAAEGGDVDVAEGVDVDAAEGGDADAAEGGDAPVDAPGDHRNAPGDHRNAPDEDVATTDGRLTLEFGVSGKLADDDLVMYDRQTGSEWKQSLGEAIAGPLSGTELAVLPAAVTTWKRFREDEPGGPVLARPGGESEASGPGDDPEPVDYDAAPYREYFEGDGFGLGAHRGEGGREWDRGDLDPKAVVLGVERGDDAVGFPLPAVREAGGALSATVGGDDVVVFATPDGIHAFENPGLEFERAGGTGVFGADGARWDGATGESDDGRRLRRVPARRLFAFAWQDDHGPDSFVGTG